MVIPLDPIFMPVRNRVAGAVLAVVLLVTSMPGCDEPAAPASQSFEFHIQSFFQGDWVRLELDDRPVFWGRATTEPLLVPVGENVRVLVTSNDVIHAFAVPAFGVKEDAIQGRVNETWFNVEREGVFYGQCSELCGVNHAYMPIEIHAVSRAEFDAWIAAQGGSFAASEPAPAAAPADGEAPVTEPAAAPTTTPTR